MKKISCDIIRDLLPLYVENLASLDTRKMIEEHIKGCDECYKQLKEMQEKVIIPSDTVIAPMTALKKKINKKKVSIIIMTVAAVTAIVMLVLVWMNTPILLEYNDNLIKFNSYENGSILVTLSDEVEGYDASGYPEREGNRISEEYIYHITVWNTLWNQYISKGKEQSFILNPNDDGSYNKVKSVYYYTDYSNKTTVDKFDRLIYGEDNQGTIVTLPRLTLTYYTLLCIAAIIVCGIIWFIFKKQKKTCRIIEKIAAIPAAYLISQICIMGFNTSTYSLLFYFYSILLLTIPVYFILIVTIEVLKKRISKHH